MRLVQIWRNNILFIAYSQDCHRKLKYLKYLYGALFESTAIIQQLLVLLTYYRLGEFKRKLQGAFLNYRNINKIWRKEHTTKFQCDFSSAVNFGRTASPFISKNSVRYLKQYQTPKVQFRCALYEVLEGKKYQKYKCVDSHQNRYKTLLENYLSTNLVSKLQVFQLLKIGKLRKILGFS